MSKSRARAKGACQGAVAPAPAAAPTAHGASVGGRVAAAAEADPGTAAAKAAMKAHPVWRGYSIGVAPGAPAAEADRGAATAREAPPAPAASIARRAAAARVAPGAPAAEIARGAAGAWGVGAPAAEAARGALLAPKGMLLADDPLSLAVDMDIASPISVWPSQGMLDILDKDEHMRVWALREGPALEALEDATSVVEQRIQDIGCAVYKIGIAMDPIQRFKGFSWSYIYEGYEEMLLLVASTATQCRILETFLIERFKGRPGCQNEAPGGEGMRDSSNLCYVYAVFCDGGTGRAWGLSARKAKRPRAREAVSTSIG